MRKQIVLFVTSWSVIMILIASVIFTSTGCNILQKKENLEVFSLEEHNSEFVGTWIFEARFGENGEKLDTIWYGQGYEVAAGPTIIFYKDGNYKKIFTPKNSSIGKWYYDATTSEMLNLLYTDPEDNVGKHLIEIDFAKKYSDDNYYQKLEYQILSLNNDSLHFIDYSGRNMLYYKLPKQFKLTDTVFEIGSEFCFFLEFQMSHHLRFRYEDEILLDSIITLINENNLIIEIQSHTSFYDTENHNNILTQKRAESIGDYMISKGVHSDNITAKGYGESQALIVTQLIHDKYPFLTIGQELNQEFIESIKDIREKQISASLCDRIVIKIIEKNN